MYVRVVPVWDAVYVVYVAYSLLGLSCSSFYIVVGIAKDLRAADQFCTYTHDAAVFGNFSRYLNETYDWFLAAKDAASCVIEGGWGALVQSQLLHVLRTNCRKVRGVSATFYG